VFSVGVPLEYLQLSHTTEPLVVVVRRREHGVQTLLLGAGAMVPMAHAVGRNAIGVAVYVTYKS